MQSKLLSHICLYLLVGILLSNQLISLQRSKVSFKDHSYRVKALTEKIESVENSVAFDSLLARTDTMKYFHLYCLGRDFAQIKPSLSVAVADSMISHSQKDNYSRGIISGYNLLGIIYTYEDDYIRALTNLKEAKKIGINSPDANEIRDKYGCTLYYLGDLYFQKKDYDIALDYYKRSFDIFDSYTEKDLAREDLNFVLTSYAFTTLREDRAYTMYSIGRSFIELNKLDSARLFLDKSLVVAIETKHNRLEAKINYSLARLEYKKQNLDLCKDFSEKSLALSKSSNLKEYEIYNYLLLMEIDLAISDYSNIEEYYNKAIPILKQMGMRNELAKALQLYAEYLNLEGNSELAFLKLNEANKIREGLNNDQVARKFGQQESAMKYQQSVYDLEVESIRAKEEEKRLTTQLYFTLAVAILLILIAVVILIYARKNKQLSSRIALTNDELELANMKLTELNDTKTKLFRIISHDLRNPIKEFDRGVTHLLNNQNPTGITQNTTYLEALGESASNIYSLLNNLLHWAESQFKDTAVTKSEVEIEKIITRTNSLFNSQIEEKNIQIITNLQIATLFTDPNILQIIVQNLIHNSIKFTPVGGAITITTTNEDDFSILEIADSGQGMTQETIVAILNTKHYYINYDDAQTGSGLGLRAVKDYIDQLGGNLFIESTPNEGTVVTVYFS